MGDAGTLEGVIDGLLCTPLTETGGEGNNLPHGLLDLLNVIGAGDILSGVPPDFVGVSGLLIELKCRMVIGVADGLRPL